MEKKKEPVTLDEIFKKAVEKANEADTGEPPLVWPELPKEETPEE